MRQLATTLFALIIVSTGCVGPSYNLEARWAPLVRVKQTTDKLLTDKTTTTIGDPCFCNDLKQWLQDYPPGSVEFEALLQHEQQHAIRQGSFDGPAELWIAKYIAEPAFRWQEEQIGWAKEITHLVLNGRHVIPEEVALWLSDNYVDPLGRQMVTYSNALVWVKATIAAAFQQPYPERRIRPQH